MIRRSGVAMRSLDEYALDKLGALEQAHLRRSLHETARSDGIRVSRNGRRLLSFSCNDYLNLTQHPAVKAAAVEAVRRYGAGSGASRLVTGNHPLFAELEARLARLKETEAACVFGSGYLANLAVVPALAGPGDLVLMDALAHACLMSGARLTGAKVLTFRHNDTAHVAELLSENRASFRHVLIATEGVFSMDGHRAPVAALAELGRRFDAWLLTDDAHGLGVVGGGRGSSFLDGRKADVQLQVGTLSKAAGSYGGYLCASSAVVELMRSRARPLIYSTALPPAAAAAAIAALDLIASDAALTALPLAKARAFTRRAGLPDAESAIVPVVLGDVDAALEAAGFLEAEGFLVVAIRPPTVPPGTARLRFAFCAAHPDDEVVRLADLVRRCILARHPVPA
jgi:8-amino-7-oxononanoate synthase